MEEDKYFIHSSAAEHNCFFNPTWENPVDQNDPFQSAMSSIVSSPTASHVAGEGLLLRELIGRLGSISSSGEMSPASGYNTPINSPPKQMRASIVGTRLPSHPTVAPFPPKTRSPENAELGDSRQGSSVSEQVPAAYISINPPSDGNVRKRKSIPRGKAKDAPSISARDTKIAADNEDSKAKKSKQDTATGNGKVKEETTQKQAKDDNSKQPEPPKDYIHVRARRGQATDSHSLAERVRREKISERMKFLQDLVPGCSKVTGKAVMLDEIINYVQSLQCQVEFLSMKLSTVHPRMDFNMESVLSKEVLQSCGSLPQQGVYPLDSSVPALPYGFIPQQLAGISNGTSMTLPRMDGFVEASAPQVSGFWEDDLQSLVQIGFGPNQSPNLNGSMASAQMKLEL